MTGTWPGFCMRHFYEFFKLGSCIRVSWFLPVATHGHTPSQIEFRCHSQGKLRKEFDVKYIQRFWNHLNIWDPYVLASDAHNNNLKWYNIYCLVISHAIFFSSNKCSYKNIHQNILYVHVWMKDFSTKSGCLHWLHRGDVTFIILVCWCTKKLYS